MNPVLLTRRLLLQRVQPFLGHQPLGSPHFSQHLASGAPSLRFGLATLQSDSLGFSFTPTPLPPPWPKFPQPWPLLFPWEFQEVSGHPELLHPWKKELTERKMEMQAGVVYHGALSQDLWMVLDHTEISVLRATVREPSSVTNSFLSPFLSAARHG